MWIEFNENPTGRRVGDCAVRAVSVALGIDWESAYCLIVVNGFSMGDMPNANSVWEIVDEAMSAIQVLNPQLYKSIMRKIEY